MDEDLMLAEHQRLEREHAAECWEDCRSRILHEGGIKPVAEDYDDLPRCLIRQRGLPLDVMATLFGYDYEDDFVRWVFLLYDHYRTTQAGKIPPLKRHWEHPEIQRLLDFYYETWRACCEARQRYGSRSHPEVAPIYQLQREVRRRYQDACKRADIPWATV